MDDLIEQMIDLQTRLRQLDAVTIRQAAQIERLEMALRQLSEQLNGDRLASAPATGHERPPHY